MYFIVYDPNGEIFEVPAFRLNELIVERQWTFWHPTEEKQVFKAEADDTAAEGAKE